MFKPYVKTLKLSNHTQPFLSINREGRVQPNNALRIAWKLPSMGARPYRLYIDKPRGMFGIDFVEEADSRPEDYRPSGKEFHFRAIRQALVECGMMPDTAKSPCRLIPKRKTSADSAVSDDHIPQYVFVLPATTEEPAPRRLARPNGG